VNAVELVKLIKLAGKILLAAAVIFLILVFMISTLTMESAFWIAKIVPEWVVALALAFGVISMLIPSSKQKLK
jgi:hypothetical protein